MVNPGHNNKLPSVCTGSSLCVSFLVLPCPAACRCVFLWKAGKDQYTAGATQIASSRGSILCRGFRSLFGWITFAAFTAPTRSRAIARTSLGALNFFGFLATGIYRTGISDSATRAAT